MSELFINNSIRNIHEANYTCAAVNGIDNFIGTPENATTELLVQGNTNIIDVYTCQSVYGILIIITYVCVCVCVSLCMYVCVCVTFLHYWHLFLMNTVWNVSVIVSSCTVLHQIQLALCNILSVHFQWKLVKVMIQ